VLAPDLVDILLVPVESEVLGERSFAHGTSIL
jgi:hypothetical protein